MRKNAGGLLGGIIVSAASLLLVLPTVVVIPMSFSGADMLTFPPAGFSTRWYENFARSSQWRTATANSLIVAVASATLATVLGTLAAIGIARERFRGRSFVQTLFLLPIILPSIVMAVAMYRTFAEIGLASTIPGLILAHTVLGIPFVVINVSAVLQKIDRRIEQAARSLGASPWRAMFHVTLPMVAPGVVVGALFAFLTSFDEIVVSLFLSGVGAITLPVRMWSGIRFEIDPTVAAVSTMLVVLTSFVFLAFLLLGRRGQPPKG